MPRDLGKDALLGLEVAGTSGRLGMLAGLWPALNEIPNDFGRSFPLLVDGVSSAGNSDPGSKKKSPKTSLRSKSSNGPLPVRPNTGTSICFAAFYDVMEWKRAERALLSKLNKTVSEVRLLNNFPERKPRTSPAYARDMRIHDLYLRYSTDYDDLPPYFRAVATELLCLAMLPCCTSCSLERAQLEMLLPRLHLNRRALRDGSDATAGGEEDWVPTT